MIRLPNAYRLPLGLLAIALFVKAQCVPLLGQSSETATAPTLDVLSAHYNRTDDTIKFSLANNTQKAVTAYYVAFGLMSENHVMWESGTGEDLLDRLLTNQCRYATANSPDGNDSWEGAIKPGDVYVHSTPSNLPKNQLTAFDPPVRVTVTGIIWSDGSVEMPTETGATRWVTSAINRQLAQRKQDAQESAKVVAILSAHPEDTDAQHRIGEATKNLQSMIDAYQRVRQAQPSGQAIPIDSSFLVSGALNNLHNFMAVPRPGIAFHAYRAVFECQSKRRIAMLPTTSPAQPAR